MTKNNIGKSYAKVMPSCHWNDGPAYMLSNTCTAKLRKATAPPRPSDVATEANMFYRFLCIFPQSGVHVNVPDISGLKYNIILYFSILIPCVFKSADSSIKLISHSSLLNSRCEAYMDSTTLGNIGVIIEKLQVASALRTR